jgi:6-phosphogluconate dehydrogenase
VLTMLPAGEPTQNLLNEVAKLLDKDDILIDAGNSYYKDTERRAQEFGSQGIRYLGVGVSGGIIAVEEGYPQMVGGDKSAYEYITPILDSLAKPGGGHEYFGPGGAGHFVKMVHNGIEYPIMQALGEGFGVLANSEYNFDLVKIAKLYQRGTLVSGFMLDRAAEALENDPRLENIEGVIGSASQETIWTIDEAKKNNLPIESIEQAQQFRVRSETDHDIQNSFAAHMVGALRIAFGGHPVKLKNDKDK